MKSIVTLVLSTLMTTALVGQSVDTTSYSLGMSVAKRLKNQGVGELDYQSLMQGIKDILDGNKALFSSSLSDSLNYEYFKKQKDIMFKEIKEEGEKFLATNGQRPEVKTTDTGLQYEILKEGEGDKPGPSNTVTVHYEGKLINGNIFDSSYERGQTISFPLNRVIAGWTEGLQLMSPGAKYRFYIPSDLAYGSRGAGSDVPPYSTLIFDVELVSF